jgi:hypothetical protein
VVFEGEFYGPGVPDPKLPEAINKSGLVFRNHFPFVSNRNIHCEVSADVEWRVNIDKVNFPFKLVQQRSHHQLVVSPNQLISEIP